MKLWFLIIGFFLNLQLIYPTGLSWAEWPTLAKSNPVNVVGWAGKYINKIGFYNSDGTLFDINGDSSIYYDSGKPIQVNCGEPKCREIKITIEASNDIPIRIYSKFKTTLSISNEGQDIPLKNWKHYESEKAEVNNLNKNEFLFKRPVSDDFPGFNSEEIRLALREELETWKKNGQIDSLEGYEIYYQKAEQCEDPGSNSCYVFVDHVVLSVEGKIDNEWTEIKNIIYRESGH